MNASRSTPLTTDDHGAGPARADDTPLAGVHLAPGVVVPEDAIRFTFARSSGPGGQNVNKRSTKAELRVALLDLRLAPQAAHRLLRLAGPLGVRVTDDGDVLITADEQRSQRQNRDACLDRLRELVARSLIAPKPRKPTKPTKGSRQRRIDTKKRRAETKQTRRKVADD